MMTVLLLAVINWPEPVTVPSSQLNVLPLANVMLPAPPSVAPYRVSVPEIVDADAIVSDGEESFELSPNT